MTTATRMARRVAAALPVRLSPNTSWVTGSADINIPVASNNLDIRPYTAQAPSPMRADAASGLTKTWIYLGRRGRTRDITTRSSVMHRAKHRMFPMGAP